MAFTEARYRKVERAHPDREIVIGETGWGAYRADRTGKQVVHDMATGATP